ncbi:MAG TPA: choice-of-anchor V domain-containing protein [Bacteroidia bacterium]|jgi:hypothetical protein|nr:choice-of-anchor V domain-containing protein [Bacteroidia bacterium]
MKKKICLLLSISFVFIICTSAILQTPGEKRMMVPFGVRDATGNPINLGAGNCSGCHSGTVVNSGGSLKITVKDLKGNLVSTYDFNKSYTVDVTVARVGVSMFGFDAEVVTANNTDAGVLTSSDTTQIQTLMGERSTNITHFTPGKTKDTHTFSFKWQSPSADSGIVTIYAAGLAANSNGKNTGDYTYTSVKTLKAVSTGIHESSEMISAISVYPNPASTSFTLAYLLKKQAYMTVNLYSLNGQKVAELLSEMKGSGFQHDDVAIPELVKKGSYLLQLISGDDVSVEKLIIDKTE